jgi:hypothetical protein
MIKFSKFKLALPLVMIAGFLGLHIPLAKATIIVNDTFDSSGATISDDANDPLDVAWSGIKSVSLSVANDAAGIGSGNALNVAASGTFSGTGAQFPTVTLNTGDSIKLAFNVRFTAAPPPTASGLRVALESTAVPATYVFREGTGGVNGGGLLLYQDATFAGSGSIGFITTGDPINNINDQLPHSAAFQITNLPTGMDMIFTLDGKTFKNFDSTLNGFSTFNRIEIGEGDQTAVPFRLDNVKVEVTTVPEPSTIILMFLACGSIGLLRWRGAIKS